MAKYLLARQLSGKKVITNEGEDFGRLVDVHMNELTGKIENLVVDPNPDSELAAKLRKEDGMLSLPYDSVLAVGDYIIVEKRNIVY